MFALRRSIVGERADGQRDTEVAAEPFDKREHRRRVRRRDVVRRLREEPDRRDPVIAQVHLDHGNGRSGDAQETFGPLIIGTKQLRPR